MHSRTMKFLQSAPTTQSVSQSVTLHLPPWVEADRVVEYLNFSRLTKKKEGRKREKERNEPQKPLSAVAAQERTMQLGNCSATACVSECSSTTSPGGDRELRDSAMKNARPRLLSAIKTLVVSLELITLMAPPALQQQGQGMHQEHPLQTTRQFLFRFQRVPGEWVKSVSHEIAVAFVLDAVFSPVNLRKTHQKSSNRGQITSWELFRRQVLMTCKQGGQTGWRNPQRMGGSSRDM